MKACSLVLLVLAPAVHAAEAAASAAPPTEGQKLMAALAVAGLVVVIGIGLVAVLGIVALLRPQRLAEDARLMVAHPWRSLATGLLGTVAFLLVLMVVGKLPEPVKGVVFLLLLPCLAWQLTTGLALGVHELGDRIAASLNLGWGSAFLNTVIGGLLLLMAFLVPVLGQVVAVVVLLCGLGAQLSAGADRLWSRCRA